MLVVPWAAVARTGGKLPVAPGVRLRVNGTMKVREIIKIIEADGWYRVKAKGGHKQYKNLVKSGRVTVPGQMKRRVGQENPKEHLETGRFGRLIPKGYGKWRLTWW